MKMLIALLMTISFNVQSSQLQIYMDEGCDTVLEDLASSFLTRNKQVIDQAVSQKYNNYYRIEPQSVQLCGVRDIEPGSFSIKRFVRYCAIVLDYKKNKHGATLYLQTQGDLFCDNEKVLFYQDIWLD